MTEGMSLQATIEQRRKMRELGHTFEVPDIKDIDVLNMLNVKGRLGIWSFTGCEGYNTFGKKNMVVLLGVAETEKEGVEMIKWIRERGNNGLPWPCPLKIWPMGFWMPVPFEGEPQYHESNQDIQDIWRGAHEKYELAFLAQEQDLKMNAEHNRKVLEEEQRQRDEEKKRKEEEEEEKKRKEKDEELKDELEKE